MNTTWILVADASRARLMSHVKRDDKYVVIEEREHPDSRAKGIDLMSDDRGRTRDTATGHGSAMAYPTNPKEVEAVSFARELADVLQHGLDEHAYTDVVLVAPPHFLGLLRDVVSDGVTDRVKGSLDKDYTRETPAEVRLRLTSALPDLQL